MTNAETTTQTLTTTGYQLEAYPLTEDGIYTEGDTHATEDDAYAEMREWMIAEGWAYETTEGGYYANDGGVRVYTLLIAKV